LSTFAVEVVGTVEPGTNTMKAPPLKPLRAVVAVGNAVIRSVIVVAVGTIRGYSDIDCYLCF